MSAEAADREAVTCSRPCTPTQTSWFEFLLDDSLLERHLQNLCPDPAPVPLIIQFLEQASKPTVNEQNQVQPPADNKRNRTLKLLALKVAAHLKWDLDALEKGLSIPVLNMLLNELLCVSKVPPGVKHVDLDLSTLPPTTTMAVLVYNRWAIRTAVKSSFPIKQAKPGPHQLNMLNHVQQEKELTENILKVLKEQADDSIAVLEAILGMKKDFYVHTMRTLDLLAVDSCTSNGETECSTAGLKISKDELHCQVSYDLGTVFFQQGCSNSSCYEKAREHFLKTRELLAKLGARAVHCKIDESRLAGYCQACGVLTGLSKGDDGQSVIYGKIHGLVKSGEYKGIVDIFLEDNVTLSLPNHFRQSILREFFQKAQQGNKTLDEVCYKICICNGVRDVLEGEVISLRFRQLLLKPTKEKLDFLLEVCTRSLPKEKASESMKKKMTSFLKNLCLSLEDLQLVFMLSSHELFVTLLKDEERVALVNQMRKRSSAINLSMKPLTSFYDMPATASVSIGQLEHQLILSVDSWRIRQILIELHGMTERQFWKVSSKWEVPPDYSSVILGIKDNLTRDLVYILMAKGLHCIAIKDFIHARQLFSACLELVTEFSPKLRQVMLNEMLLLDITAHEAEFEGSRERPPPDLVSRVRGYLEMRIHDIPLRQILGKECVAFMLNWRENEYLTLQVPATLVQNNPYVKLGQLLAATCKELPGPKETRRTAKDLWEVVVQICSFSSQHKRANDGRISLIKHRESTLGIMHRSAFVAFIQKLREPLVLTTLVSLFVRLHSIVRDDIVNEVTAEHLSIWPTSLPNLQSVDVEAVAITLKEVVNHALTLNPTNHSWLITQADIYFVTSQYSAALHHYLQAGAVCSDFFNKAVPADVYTDQVLKRMIRCCSHLNCHTQVAILCQFLREVDYMTAFKALQEQNSHDAMDSLYEYIWDVTILEYLTYIHHKRGETEKRQIAIKAIGQTELNASNPEDVLQLAAQKRKKKFLQAMAKLYF
ncbi:integrator complex subunit 8 [Polypterus senegalus]|uniref:integrator complex subunit 8 n=1 Tax=Polypterus senegalus TaxID=55291 RepID=UPI0019654083|nr:integrator complex subunit 8 [Polypterus senegalus]XP_039593761.1 integrator complex subunit 8 [Polypterus senegalus]